MKVIVNYNDDMYEGNIYTDVIQKPYVFNDFLVINCEMEDENNVLLKNEVYIKMKYILKYIVIEDIEDIGYNDNKERKLIPEKFGITEYV